MFITKVYSFLCPNWDFQHLHLQAVWTTWNEFLPALALQDLSHTLPTSSAQDKYFSRKRCRIIFWLCSTWHGGAYQHSFHLAASIRYGEWWQRFFVKKINLQRNSASTLAPKAWPWKDDVFSMTPPGRGLISHCYPLLLLWKQIMFFFFFLNHKSHKRLRDL